MNSRNSPPTLLLVFAFAVACAGTAGLTVWAADTKTAPAKTEKAAKSEERRASLKISVDTKPINRDAPDRISYAPIVKRTAASVVYVYSSQKVPGQDMTLDLNDPLLRRFFGIPDGVVPRGNDDETPRINPRRAPKNNSPKRAPNNSRKLVPDQTRQGLGSGVVLTADGYILTNNHVIEGADDVKVSIGESSKRYEAKVVGRDALTDVAVLKIEATGLSPAVIGDSDQLQVGDAVFAIGNPFGVGQSVSRGIVSALGRGVGIGQVEDFIQTDAAINVGNSGGALIDTDGRVVGINTAILSRGGGFSGVGFAIPINLVRNVAEQVVNTGRFERAYLGVYPQDLSDELIASFGSEKGAIVSDISPESPAEKAGLKPGDVITRVDKTEIRDSRHLLITLAQMRPETKVTIEYLRESKKATVDVRLGHRPAETTLTGIESVTPTKDVGVLNGVGVADITPEIRDQLQLPARVQGAIITSVEPDSPSAQQGLREGDIILQLDRKPVANAEEAVKLSEEIKGPSVLVLIWREGRRSFLVIDESK
jgi:serine protease Do